MTARCDFLGCSAEDQIEVELRPGPDINEYGTPTTVKGVLMKMPPRWTTGYVGGVYCPKHPGGVPVELAGEDERRAYAIECPACGAPVGTPCMHAGNVVATHRLRYQRSGDETPTKAH
jgi:hypothetical protein